MFAWNVVDGPAALPRIVGDRLVGWAEQQIAARPVIPAGRGRAFWASRGGFDRDTFPRATNHPQTKERPLTLIRIAFLGLAVLLPTSWTIAQAADEAPAGEAKPAKKGKKEKKDKGAEGDKGEKKAE